jgi:hypothetical protein
MRRLAEPIKKSFDGVTFKEELEVVSSLLSKIEKALSHGRGDAANIPGAHAIASR